MKNFKDFYLAEMPFPRNVDVEKFKQQKLSFGSLINTFTNHFGKPIANGSSRSVYAVKVPATEFNSDMKEELGLDFNFEGEVDTVFKVAKNKKGVVQNKVEADTYRDAKFLHYERFFCPIVDVSKRILNLKDVEWVEGDTSEEGLMFVQMAKCEKITRAQMTKLLANTFGYNSKKDNKPVFNLYNFGIMIATASKGVGRYDDKYLDEPWITEEQRENTQGLLNACMELKISDLFSYANWGVYKGNPVLLDYGFNHDSTGKLYWNNNTSIVVWQDAAGNPNYKIRS